VVAHAKDKIRCPGCGQLNFPSDANCWACGRRLPGAYAGNSSRRPSTPPPGLPDGRHRVITLIKGVLLAGALLTALPFLLVDSWRDSLISALSGSSAPTPSGPAKQEPLQGGITLEQYNQVQPGMTSQQVNAILGSCCTFVSSSGEVNSRVVIFEWPGHGEIGANCDIAFLRGRVITKSQYGLQ
jgi:hypothetical protein